MNNHATTQLKLAIEIARNNLPINLREGNLPQAQLEGEVIRDCEMALSALDHVKLASFLSANPGVMDYARVGGRTALEGGLGGYGGSSLMAALLGIVGRRFGANISPSMFAGLTTGAGTAGALAGGLHGYRASMANARQRLGPIGRFKRFVGIQ